MLRLVAAAPRDGGREGGGGAGGPPMLSISTDEFEDVPCTVETDASVAPAAAAVAAGGGGGDGAGGAATPMVHAELLLNFLNWEVRDDLWSLFVTPSFCLLLNVLDWEVAPPPAPPARFPLCFASQRSLLVWEVGGHGHGEAAGVCAQVTTHDSQTHRWQ